LTRFCSGSTCSSTISFVCPTCDVVLNLSMIACADGCDVFCVGALVPGSVIRSVSISNANSTFCPTPELDLKDTEHVICCVNLTDTT
jgi:hypothetical protein